MSLGTGEQPGPWVGAGPLSPRAALPRSASPETLSSTEWPLSALLPFSASVYVPSPHFLSASLSLSVCLSSHLGLPLFSSGLRSAGPSPTSAPSLGPPVTPGTHSSLHPRLTAPPCRQLLLCWVPRTEGVGSGGSHGRGVGGDGEGTS